MALACLAGWAAAAGLTATPAYASKCPNASTCFPDVFGPENGTLLADLSVPVTSSSGTMHATYIEAVYADPSNTYCSECLDILLQVSNSANSTVPIVRVTVYDFSPVLADIGYTPNQPTSGGNPFSSGTVVPYTVDRNATANTIGFNFPVGGPAPSPIAPGATTEILEVQTSGTTFASGTVSLIDGGTTTSSGFEPQTPAVLTPEAPWTAGFALLGAGAAGAVFIGRRRKRRRNPLASQAGEDAGKSGIERGIEDGFGF